MDFMSNPTQPDQCVVKDERCATARHQLRLIARMMPDVCADDDDGLAIQDWLLSIARDLECAQAIPPKS